MATRIICGDALATLRTLPSASVHSVITSPPYFALRSYLDASHPDKALELGSEPTVADYIAALVGVFRECRRVMRPDASLFVNLGDSYAGPHNGYSGDSRPSNGNSKSSRNNGARENGQVSRPGLSKSLLLIPQRIAIALSDDGWIIRSVSPWIKRSALPESVTDRFSNAVEYVIHAVQRPKYFWDAVAVQRAGAFPEGTLGGKASVARSSVPGVSSRPPEYKVYSGTRNFRNTDLFFDSLEPPYGAITDADGTLLALDVNPEATSLPHYACFPSKLVSPLIRASTSERGCCANCGKQWIRDVDRVLTRPGVGGGSTPYPHNANGRTLMRGGLGGGSSTTLGWSASCRCAPSDPVPATVLDCFAGACTTLLQAQRLGRDAIGIELSETYCAMARARLEVDAGLFADILDDAAPAPAAAAGAVVHATADLFAPLEAE